MAGVPAALWLLGLFAAAPALRIRGEYGIADRLRDALVLGVVIPLLLGFVHLLYPVACWCALALCIAVAYFRRTAEPRGNGEAPAYVLIAALAAVTWPQLVRPLLDGDSLSYHLPNAAAWAQSHSIWTTATRYWWYPPASELFASALYTVGTPFTLPWSGLGALALLGFRIVAWARAYGASPLLADALAAATVTAYPIAIQGGTLQNDVWLAAFWLETLWLLSPAMSFATVAPAVAVTALLKPQGWILAAVALLACKAPARLWLAAAIPLGAWLAHDALLWRSAAASAGKPHATAFNSTILAHGLPALLLLDRVAVAASPFALLAYYAALLGPAIARDRRLGWAALGAALLFFVLPFGYDTSVAQLATGASLRFAAPAIAAGAIVLCRPASRIAGVSTVLLLASTVFGCIYVLNIFWNDGTTHVAVAVAALAVALAVAAHLSRAAWPHAIAFGIAVIVATHLAARHPLDYYADALRVGGTSPGIYRWIKRERPTAIGGWGVRLGVVNVLSPSTRTIDLPDDAACAQARRDGVLLAAVAENDRSLELNAQRLRSARACGLILYDDPIGAVARP